MRSPVLHVFALVAFALASWQRLAIAHAPIEGDRAYFTYFAQAVLRGEPIYAVDFLGYPPVGPLASAGAMALGRLAGVATPLAPRYAALALALACVVLVYAVARRATGSAVAGLVAGLALAGMERWVWSACATLEPKHLVLGLALAAGAALQARRPFLAGAAAALAAGCWQPAGLVVPTACLASVVWDARRAPLRPLSRLLFGGAAGALPSLAYLAAHGAWAQWWLRAVEIPAAFELASAGGAPGRPLAVARAEFGGDLAFFLAAGAGFAAFAWGSRRGGARGLAEAWLGARRGALPLQTLGWVAFSAWTFGGVADLYVLLPPVAFWAGVAVDGALRGLARCGVGPRALRIAAALAVAGVAAYALLPSAGFLASGSRAMRGDHLGRQQRLARAALELAGPGGGVAALAVEELYAFGERRAPVPFLRLPEPWIAFLPRLGLADCDAALAALVAARPAVVALDEGPSASACERGAGDHLRARGYRLARRLAHVALYAPDAGPGAGTGLNGRASPPRG